MSCNVKREERVKLCFTDGEYEYFNIEVGEKEVDMGDASFELPVALQIFERCCDEIRRKMQAIGDHEWKSRGGMGGKYIMGGSD